MLFEEQHTQSSYIVAQLLPWDWFVVGYPNLKGARGCASVSGFHVDPHAVQLEGVVKMVFPMEYNHASKVGNTVTSSGLE
jgi:hypothetical protein